MHEPEDTADFALLGEDREKNGSVLFIVLECPVDEQQPPFDQIVKFCGKLQLVFLS